MKYLILLFLLLSAVKADIVTITSDTWYPYNSDAQEAKNRGFMIDVFTHIFNKAGHEVKYVVARSYEQAIKDVRAHKYDAIVAITKEEAPDFIFPKKPLAYASDIIIIPQNSTWEYTKVEDLNQRTLGVVKGYYYGKELDAYIQKNKNNKKKIQEISGNHSFEYNLKKLQYKKINTLIDDKLLIYSYYAKRGKKMPYKVAHTLNEGPLYIAFSPKHYKSKRYAKILTKGLKKLRGSVEMQKILQKYGLKERDILK